jgi:hypothetical protein
MAEKLISADFGVFFRPNRCIDEKPTARRQKMAANIEDGTVSRIFATPVSADSFR